MSFKSEACAGRRPGGSASRTWVHGLLVTAVGLLLLPRPVPALERPDVHGFVEAIYGPKLSDDGRTRKDEFNILEQRLQLKVSWRPPASAPLSSWQPGFFYKGDLVVDEYDEAVRYRIRELHVSASPFTWLDVKIGRQILTWGTGDLLFINDVFPKDFVSFFIGRDDEYLKVPSDAAKLSVFSPWASLDLVLLPFFAPDTAIPGERLSFYDRFLGRLAGMDSHRLVTEPSSQPKNTELAARVSGTGGAYEVAGYAFRGFFTQAVGIKNPDARELFYPERAVYGASLRGPAPMIGGIAYGEIGYDDSLEDRSGKNRLIENSSIKYLAGYERDFPKDLRLGLQYYAEQMLDFGRFTASVQPGDVPRNEFRQLLTLRITKLFWMQTLEMSFFALYSPTDDDAYLRPRLTWQLSDQWKATVGADVFFGTHDWTELGQFEGNDHVFIRVRYTV